MRTSLRTFGYPWESSEDIVQPKDDTGDRKFVGHLVPPRKSHKSWETVTEILGPKNFNEESVENLDDF